MLFSRCLCGPTVDPVLPKFAADLEWLRSQGVEVERYNLAQEVGAFTYIASVRDKLAHRLALIPWQAESPVGGEGLQLLEETVTK